MNVKPDFSHGKHDCEPETRLFVGKYELTNVKLDFINVKSDLICAK